MLPLFVIMRGEPKSEFDLFVIDRVKTLRNERKISQAVLAVKLGVSNAFIGQVENPKNRCKYSVEQLNRLAIIFNICPKDLLPDKAIITKSPGTLI